MNYLLALLLFTTPAKADYKDTVSSITDYTLLGNAARTYAIAAKHDSWRGVAGVTLGIGSQWLVNNAVKHEVQSPRPNGKDNLNWWSGHMATSVVLTTITCSYEPGEPCITSIIATAVVGSGRVISLNHTIGAVTFAIIPGYFHGVMGFSAVGEF